MKESKLTEVQNSTGYVDKASLRAPAPVEDDVPAPQEDVPLSVPHRAPDVACCPMLDVEHGKCTQMDVTAQTTKGGSGPICLRQTNRWLGNNLPCNVPKILALSWKNHFFQGEKLRSAQVQVLNAIAMEDRCPYAKTGGSGPVCGKMGQVLCVKPEGHAACRVFQILETFRGIVQGPQNWAKVQQAYDAEISDIQGTTVSTVNPNVFVRPER